MFAGIYRLDPYGVIPACGGQQLPPLSQLIDGVVEPTALQHMSSNTRVISLYFLSFAYRGLQHYFATTNEQQYSNTDGIDADADKIVLIQSNLKYGLLFCEGGHVFILIAILFAMITVGLDTVELEASDNVNCDVAYPDVCIESPPPDLDCDDVPVKGFKVVSPDPHGFDREGDGIGCEAENRNDVISRNANNGPSLAPLNQVGECKGSADCFSGKVTEIVDGDTIDVNNVRIRLSMVNTPERGEAGYNEATDFTESICPVGSDVLVDEDDGQREGSYDRLIGVVYCNRSTASMNQLLLEYGKAIVYEDFCEVSEFGNDKWVTSFGCM